MKFLFVLFCLILSGNGSHTVSKQNEIMNDNNDQEATFIKRSFLFSSLINNETSADTTSSPATITTSTPITTPEPEKSSETILLVPVYDTIFIPGYAAESRSYFTPPVGSSNSLNNNLESIISNGSHRYGDSAVSSVDLDHLGDLGHLGHLGQLDLLQFKTINNNLKPSADEISNNIPFYVDPIANFIQRDRMGEQRPLASRPNIHHNENYPAITDEDARQRELRPLPLPQMLLTAAQIYDMDFVNKSEIKPASATSVNKFQVKQQPTMKTRSDEYKNNLKEKNDVNIPTEAAAATVAASSSATTRFSPTLRVLDDNDELTEEASVGLISVRKRNVNAVVTAATAAAASNKTTTASTEYLGEIDYDDDESVLRMVKQSSSLQTNNIRSNYESNSTSNTNNNTIESGSVKHFFNLYQSNITTTNDAAFELAPYTGFLGNYMDDEGNPCIKEQIVLESTILYRYTCEKRRFEYPQYPPSNIAMKWNEVPFNEEFESEIFDSDENSSIIPQKNTATKIVSSSTASNINDYPN